MRLPPLAMAVLVATLPFGPGFAQAPASPPAANPPAAIPPADPSAGAPRVVPMRDPPASFAPLARQLLPAVVNISTTQNVQARGGIPRPDAPDQPQAPPGSPFEEFFRDFFNRNRPGQPGPGGPEMQRPRRAQSLGSGFVIDPSGIVVTNNHVIDGADEINVILQDNTSIRAELLGTDPRTDLAVLRIKTDKPLGAVGFGDSDNAQVGDWVLAIGNPFGLGGSVTAGIVSARGRDIRQGLYDDFIQTDAAINRGNSGGPLFNMEGEVIGINTAIISPSGGSIGIGFSIPSVLAVGVVDQLRQFGETRRGWLGVRIQPVTDDIAESLGMATAKGALVSGVIKGGPVDDGTILAGDVIIKFDGRDVDEMRDLPRVVAESPVGKAVDVVIIRKGVEQTVKVTLGRLEDGEKLASEETEEPSADAEAVSTATVLGMTVGELNDEARSKFGIAKEVSGVVVTEVAADSLAAERGIAVGEVITEIAQETVGSPKDVLDRVAALKEQGRKNALLMLSSKTGELRFVTLRMD